MPADAPTAREHRFRTAGGIEVARRTVSVPLEPDPVAALGARLDHRRGVLLASSYEYPGRYTRWDIGFADPPIEIAAWGRRGTVRALNERGAVLLDPIRSALEREPHVIHTGRPEAAVEFVVREPEPGFTEEDRSRQPTVFSALRTIAACFGAGDDPYLGLYGAFGYDLAFQFDPIRPGRTRAARAAPLVTDPGSMVDGHAERDGHACPAAGAGRGSGDRDQHEDHGGNGPGRDGNGGEAGHGARVGRDRDLVLHLPDAILVVDHRAATAEEHRFDFAVGGRTTAGLPRTGPPAQWRPARTVEYEADHLPGEYADCVRAAREFFRRGDLFEVVPGQSFFAPCAAPPSEVFRRLRTRNPAPYGALMNLGEGEYLVAASPEMYVRVDGRRIETCPISGTVARGADAIGDAAQILKLLSSEKEASELTMCTDVDRNDKSRVCEPGSVRVIGRRQIEMYSRLIHTVDHVEGRLREGFDALDGFLAHTWAVTVTGAPKHAAMQFIEDHEKSVRRWYGGAIGMIGFDGNMNTGLTLRTVQIRDGAAEVRAGATLLFDSDPEAEEEETRLKAAALLDAIARPDPPAGAPGGTGAEAPGAGRTVLMVDHQDSFVHTLAAYLRETGAEVVTLRAGFAPERIDELAPDLVVLSPGPGRPADFGVAGTVGAAFDRGLPLFGVCLGLQGIVEYFGGRLGTLDEPMHGKPSAIRWRGGRLLPGLPERFEAGRYHSLFAERDSLPECLEVTAETEDGVVMAVEHRRRPIAAVQFHPESILTLGGEVGRRLIHRVVERLRAPAAETCGRRAAAG